MSVLKVGRGLICLIVPCFSCRVFSCLFLLFTEFRLKKKKKKKITILQTQFDLCPLFKKKKKKLGGGGGGGGRTCATILWS